MSSLLQSTINWSGPQGGGLTSVLNFSGNGAETAADIRENVRDFLVPILPKVTGLYSYSVNTEVRRFDEASGGLMETLFDGTPYAGVGGDNGLTVPDVSQALIRWSTNDTRLGRRVRGRTFIPGLGVGQTVGGNVLPAAQTALAAGVTAMLAGPAIFVIWCRPVSGPDGVPGTTHLVTGGTPWSEFAVLRSRRA